MTEKNPAKSIRTKPVDAADLVAHLVSMSAPSREVDCLVDVMLGGSQPHLKATAVSVVQKRWLAGEVPSYTQGGSALAVLAHRRGLRIRSRKDGCAYRAECSDPVTGRQASAIAPLQGCAGIAAIARLFAGATQ